MIIGALRLVVLWLFTSLIAWAGWLAGVKVVGGLEPINFGVAAMGVLLIWLAVFMYSLLEVER